jgi:hypothetical protein
MLNWHSTRAAIALGAVMACRMHGGVGILKADTYVSSGSPSTNFGASTLMNIGAGNSGLVQFDFSPAVSRMLTGVTPTTVTPILGHATLTVFVNKAVTAGTLSAAPLLGAWSESTVNFSTLPSQAPTVGSAPVSAGGQFVSIDVTPIVAGWLSNNNDPTSPNYVGGGNFGIYLSSPDGGVFILDTKEGTTTSHSAQLDIDLASNFTGTLRKDLTFSAPGFTSLMSIHLTGTNTAGGRVFYMVRATDGGSQIATEEGVIQFNATANSITCTVQTTDKLHLGTVNSGCTPGFFNPLSQPGVSIFDNVTFSSPAPIVVHEVFYSIQNLSGAVIRLEP